MHIRFISGVRFTLALIFSVLVLACETSFDPDGSIPLAGPAKVQVTAKDGALVLQWTKVSPAQGVVPKYEVYYSTGSNPASAEKWELVTAGEILLVTSTITGLTNGTPYYVWVKAVYANIGESNFIQGYGIPIPPPAAPGALTVYPGEEMLEVTWAAVTNAFTYEVYYSSTGKPPDEEETAGTMITVSGAGIVISGLNNGTSYTVWVRSVNTAGNSPGYASTSGTPTAAASVPAAAPGTITVTPGAGKLTLTWDQVHGVPQYKLYYNTINSTSGTTEVSATISASAPAVTADITGLNNGTTYYVWVRSWNSRGGSSSYSPSASGTPTAKPAINFGNLQFELGSASAEFVFAQDVPASVFFPEGRPNTDRLTRVQETALGNLFADGMAWYVREKLGKPIDFVFLNGGYIDNVISEGKITVGTISGIVGSNYRKDKIFLLKMSGANLKLFFDDVANVVHIGRGGAGTGDFGIVSKEVRYTIQYYKPPTGTSPELSNTEAEPYCHGFIKPGTLKINGADIVDGQTYYIGTTDYNASGIYYTKLNLHGTDKEPVNTPFWHGVAEYIYDKGTVTPYLPGNVKLEGGVPLPPPWIPGDLVKP
ncbi:MAG: fibronectin type III domain-containing protein [Treponema sp.]|jgi:hypothetical protein|nr:fibronectin type III domain-containing protein [Treponema sp.]